MLAYDPGLGVNYNIAPPPYCPSCWPHALPQAACPLRPTIGILGRPAWAARWSGWRRLHALSRHVGARNAGSIAWSWDLVAVRSIGTMFGAASLWIAIHRSGTSGMLTAGVLLTLAIVSHHFTAMGAVEIVPDPGRVINALSLSPAWMAIGIASAAVAVLAMSLAGAFVDKRTAERIAHMAPPRSADRPAQPGRIHGSVCHGAGTLCPRRKRFAILCIDSIGSRRSMISSDIRPAISCCAQVADRLFTAGKGAFVARLGGDEFTIIVQEDEQPAGGSVAESCCPRMSEKLEVDGHRIARRCQRRRRDLSGRRRGCRDAARQRGRGALSGEGRGARHDPILCRRHGHAASRTARLQHDLRSAWSETNSVCTISRRRRPAARSSASRRWSRWYHPKRGMVPPARSSRSRKRAA